MATLIPTINSCLAGMTSGEKRFARRLESHLEKDYSCWYDIPVGPSSLHPDFVVLHPSRGLLVLEVKDWKLDTIRRIDRKQVELLTSHDSQPKANPLEQARKYAHAIVDELENDPQLVHPPWHKFKGRLIPPWGYGVVLAGITRNQFESTDLGDVLPPHRVICKDEMTESVGDEEFQKRLWDMFTVSCRDRLSLPQIDRIRAHLFPEIIINQGPLVGKNGTPIDWERANQEIIDVIDLQQEQLARSLGEGHRVIHGVAGAGKTLILVYRCVHLAQLGWHKPILVLCYNKTLAQELQIKMDERHLGAQVHVRHFHKWCRDQLVTYHVRLPPNGPDYHNQLVQRVIEATAAGHIPSGQYSAVMIDEGHDFKPEWFKLAVQMVDPKTNSVLVLYDDAQSIYGGSRRRFSFSSAGVQARGRTTILRINYRNTDEVLHVAARFARELLSPQEAEEDGIPLIAPESAGGHGPPPLLVKLPDLRAEIDYIAEHFKEAHTNDHPWRHMALLCRSRWIGECAMERLKAARIPYNWLNIDHKHRTSDTVSDAIRIVTMHSSKGLEFPIVGIPGIGYMPRNGGDSREETRLLYVAMTRATEELMMTGHQESEFVLRLQEVTDRMAA